MLRNRPQEGQNKRFSDGTASVIPPAPPHATPTTKPPFVVYIYSFTGRYFTSSSKITEEGLKWSGAGGSTCIRYNLTELTTNVLRPWHSAHGFSVHLSDDNVLRNGAIPERYHDNFLPHCLFRAYILLQREQLMFIPP